MITIKTEPLDGPTAPVSIKEEGEDEMKNNTEKNNCHLRTEPSFIFKTTVSSILRSHNGSIRPVSDTIRGRGFSKFCFDINDLVLEIFSLLDLDLARNLLSFDGGNRVFSPQSFIVILGILIKATRGPTRQQLLAFLTQRIPSNEMIPDILDETKDIESLIDQKLSQLWLDIKPRPSERDIMEPNLRLLNCFFVQNGNMVIDRFAKSTRKYNVRCVSVDFAGDNRTHWRLNAELAAMAGITLEEVMWMPFRYSFDPRTTMVAASSASISAVVPFRAAYSWLQTGSFVDETGKVLLDCKFVSSEDQYLYSHLKELSVSAIRVPLVSSSSRTSLMFLLPDIPSSDSLAALEERLNAIHIERMASNMSMTSVSLKVPQRIQIETTWKLSSLLKKLHVDSAFDPSNADFSGMVEGESQRVLLTELIQVSRVTITCEIGAGNEHSSWSSDCKHIHLNRPFMFVFLKETDSKNHLILSTGCVRTLAEPPLDRDPQTGGFYHPFWI